MDVKWHDVSIPIRRGMTVWPGDPDFEFSPLQRIAEGAGCNVSRVSMSCHTGTHVDAPWHFEEEGAKLDEVDTALYFGKALLIEVPSSAGDIEARHLEGIELPPRVLFKTRNSEYPINGPFVKEYAAVAEDAAELLVRAGVKLVGVDYLSVESFHAEFEHPVHKKLLGEGMVVVEGLNLSEIKPGDYELICMPLKIKHGDGTPVRAALRELPKKPKVKRRKAKVRKSKKSSRKKKTIKRSKKK